MSATPRIVFQRAVILGWICVFGSLHVATLASLDVPGQVRWDARLQVRWLERSLGEADADRAARLFPEGRLFLWAFYGFALENIAETTGSREDVDRARREVARLLPEVEAALYQEPFKGMRHQTIRGGVIWFSVQNLLRGRLLRLGGGDRADVERFHHDSALLAEAFAASPTGALESYPGLVWPVDNAFGYASLAVHDALYGTRYATAFERYRQTLQASGDPATGLAASMLYPDGRVRDLPRGCALSWSLAVFPQIDRDYAAAQWQRYRREMGRCAGGVCLFREYPVGRARAADADSGPIVDGLGMSASGFALAAARANVDLETTNALERAGDLVGLAGISWWGKRYLGGAVKTLDVFALWAKTVPLPRDMVAAPVGGLSPVVLVAALFWLVLAAVVARDSWVAWRSRGGQVATRTERVMLALAAGALGLHLAVATIPFAIVLVIWTLLGFVERALSRKRYGALAIS